MTKLITIFRNFANTPKNYICKLYNNGFISENDFWHFVQNFLPSLILPTKKEKQIVKITKYIIPVVFYVYDTWRLNG
jgi:hypothetical protein